ncbi:unnamed protein product [Polarella glacialis]|uniref:Uncharacterized protein n=1 Tax=Polarella glacialis TaxID=89957 RepID=A0A813DNG4_POLGL|nr:unnamed protein product [Polarella glacialis]
MGGGDGRPAAARRRWLALAVGSAAAAAAALPDAAAGRRAAFSAGAEAGSRRSLLLASLAPLAARPAAAAAEEGPAIYDPRKAYLKVRREEVEESRKTVQQNLEGAIAGVCRGAEALAQEAKVVRKGGAMAEDLQRVVQNLLVNRHLEEDMVLAAFILNLGEAQESRALAVEALESITEGLRPGALEGPRQQRVAERLLLAQDQLLEFLGYFPKETVGAVAAVERENKDNAPGYKAIFPWRKS